MKLAEEEAKLANPTPGSSGPPSKCEPFREKIIEMLEVGLSAQRIWQDLTYEHGLEASYCSVNRFVRRLREEAKVDFGKGAQILRTQQAPVPWRHSASA